MILDDFKTALDKLSRRNMSRLHMEAGFDDHWAHPKAMTMHIESPTTPARIATAGRRKSEGSIEVRTEVKIESFHMEYAEAASPHSSKFSGM